MNFKTTVILLALLVVVGSIVLFTRQTGETPRVRPEGLLLDVAASDITRMSFKSDEGNITLERSGAHWRLTEPVNAPADDFAAGSLADAVAALESRATVEANAATGLDKPAQQLLITTKDGKGIKLDIGARTAAGDNLYIRRDGQSQADVVPATLADQLEKPLRDWRRDRLLDVNASQISQVRVATTQQSIALEKHAEDWKLTAPREMPADSSSISSMTSAIANMRAVDFVANDSSDLKRFGLDQPVITVAFSTAPPATQPTTQPSFITIQFGRFDDVLKKNVYASISDQPGVVKVAATTLDAFRKQPLDLRDRQLLSLDPDKVAKITLATDKPATTQPTTREASHATVVLERAKLVMGPILPATQPATTQASTQPTDPPSKWLVASRDGAEADDAKVDSLLGEFRPMRVNRYLESEAATQPVATHTVTIETTDARHVITFIDPGDGKPVRGSYNGLTFEVPRLVLDRLEADFAKPPPTPPATQSLE